MSDDVAPPTHATAPALALRGIGKRFGDVVALDGATLEVAPGTVHALLGENGAGKSTLVRVAFGLVRPDRGEMTLGDRAFRPRAPVDALAAGVGMVHQHFSLVPAMTAAENVALGGRGGFDSARAAARLAALADESGLRVDPHARVADLPVAAQQRLEILKALARGARLLMLDEPTAVLAPSEAEELLAWLRAYAARGNAAVLITHKLREALHAADAVTVLRRGRTVLTAAARGLDAATLAEAMMGGETGRGGREEAAAEASAFSTIGGPPPSTTWASAPSGRATESSPVASSPSETPVLSARGLAFTEAATRVVRVRGATLVLRAGEIVGLAAVEGAGHHELLRLLAGRLAPTGGELVAPADARIAFVPEDRHRDAVALDLPLVENVLLRGAGARRGTIDWSGARARTASLLHAHDVRAEGPDAPVTSLSGGNQQKLVLARELADAPLLVIAESPTRGLDVHASAQVHARLRDAARAGAAVVFHSPDIDEVLALADRVVVMHAGELREVPRERGPVGRAMLGVA